jgi:diguanylate cyclase (GGDEF)-like protein
MDKRSQPGSTVPRIGLMIIPSDPFWIQVYQAIVKTHQRISAELITLHPATRMDQLDSYAPEAIIDQVLAHDLDVLITTEIPSAILSGLLNSGLPVLCLAEVVKESHPQLTILAELYAGGVIAGEVIGQKLAGKGHAIVVTAAKQKIISVGQSRLRGFMDAIQKFPAIQVDHIPCFWDYPETYLELLQQFKNYTRPVDAIFGLSDSILFAARDAGLKTGMVNPETVLVGLNGDPQALVAVAEGTFYATIDVDIENLGAKAIEYAHQAALGRPIPKTIPQVCKLVTAENVAAVAAHKLAIVADLPNYLVGYDRQKEHNRLLEYEALAEISHQIGSLLNRAELSSGISASVRQGFGYDWVRILRYNPLENKLVHYGGDVSPVSDQTPLEQDYLLQTVLVSQEPIIIPDTLTSLRVLIGSEWRQVRARAILPIKLGADLLGVLDLQSSHPILQSSFETAGFKMLGEQVGIAIQNADLYQEALQARQQAEAFVAENARLYAELMHSSIQDELTSALNRRGLMERGRNEWSHARRLNYPLGIIMFDLDNFKNINDTFGHAVGDRVLKVVVETCQARIREIDILGRYGGDEFVILLPGSSLEPTAHVAKRLLESVGRVCIQEESSLVKVTISIGIAVCGPEEISFEDLFQKADLALYAAKQAGKNTICGL